MNQFANYKSQQLYNFAKPLNNKVNNDSLSKKLNIEKLQLQKLQSNRIILDEMNKLNKVEYKIEHSKKLLKMASSLPNGYTENSSGYKVILDKTNNTPILYNKKSVKKKDFMKKQISDVHEINYKNAKTDALLLDRNREVRDKSVKRKSEKKKVDIKVEKNDKFNFASRHSSRALRKITIGRRSIDNTNISEKELLTLVSPIHTSKSLKEPSKLLYSQNCSRYTHLVTNLPFLIIFYYVQFYIPLYSIYSFHLRLFYWIEVFVIVAFQYSISYSMNRYSLYYLKVLQNYIAADFYNLQIDS
jgi:hypothetical protein